MRFLFRVRLFVLAALVSVARRSTPPPSTPAATAVSPDTWALVDGREIKREDVEKAYRRNPQAAQLQPEEEALEAKLTLLNDLIM